MEEIKIDYKDNYPCIYEGMNHYLSMFSIKRKRYILICAVVSALNLFMLNCSLIIKEEDKILFIMECILVLVLFVATVLYYCLYVKIHLRQAASKIFSEHKDQHKQLLIRQEDILFSRDYCKSNYFYDEFFCVIEGEKSISFVVEKNSYPVIFSKTEENSEEIKKACLILKEKLSERYIDNTKGGRRK